LRLKARVKGVFALAGAARKRKNTLKKAALAFPKAVAGL